MAEFTKEQLQQIAETDHVQCGDAAAMASQLLAGLEQEPVAWRWNYGGSSNWRLQETKPSKGSNTRCPRVIQPLYAAPQLPQPAVPDEWRMMCGEWRDETVSIHDSSGLIVSGISPNAAGIIIEAHNACRAAMLQGDRRDLTHPVDPQIAAYEKIMEQAVPDGWVAVPVEPTEDMVIAGFEAELREEFRDPEAWEAFEAMSGCEQAALRAKWCWAAMINAAPKP